MLSQIFAEYNAKYYTVIDRYSLRGRGGGRTGKQFGISGIGDRSSRDKENRIVIFIKIFLVRSNCSLVDI